MHINVKNDLFYLSFRINSGNLSRYGFLPLSPSSSTVWGCGLITCSMVKLLEVKEQSWRQEGCVHIVVVCETVTTHAPTPSSLAKPASQRLSSRIQNKTKHPLLSRANDLVRVASLPVMKTASIFGSSFWSAVWVELCWPTAKLSLKIWLQTRLEDGSSIEIEWLE